MSVGLFTLKKSVLINKFNTYIINIVKHNVKWGIYQMKHTVPISPDYSYMITNVEKD